MSSRQPKQPCLVANNLSKTYKSFRNRVEAVKNASFELKPGEFAGLLGPNGAGKTTLLSMLVGILTPTNGSAAISGNPIGSSGSKRSLGYLAEHVALPLYHSPRSLLKMALAISDPYHKRPREAVDEAIDRCGLSSHANRSVGKLSAGQRQLVGWAQALIHKPKLLLLDEPTSHLDPENRIKVRKWLKDECKSGAAILLSTHIVSDVEKLADRVIIMKEGSVVKTLTTSKKKAGLEKKYLAAVRKSNG